MSERKQDWVERFTNPFGLKPKSDIAEFLFPDKHGGITQEFVSTLKQIWESLILDEKEFAESKGKNNIQRGEAINTLKQKSASFGRGVFIGISVLPELLGGIKEDSRTDNVKKNLLKLKTHKEKDSNQ
jgi:hypothetical protein